MDVIRVTNVGAICAMSVNKQRALLPGTLPFEQFPKTGEHRFPVAVFG